MKQVVEENGQNAKLYVLIVERAFISKGTARRHARDQDLSHQ